MAAPIVANHRLRNALQSAVIIAGMMLILGWSAELLFGPGSFYYAAAGVAIVLLAAPRAAPRLILRMYRAQPLDPRQLPELASLVAVLAQRAGLPRPPRLYYVPSRMLNAFAVGDRRDAAIAVTEGLLQTLNLRELAGVLAHEISHVRHGDMRVMALADTVSRLTSSLSLFGQLLILLNLPLFLTGAVTISWVGLLLLVFAPTASALLQLALSRTREFDADAGAVELTGDPEGLASALAKLERHQGGWLQRVLVPGRRNPDPSLLRTHPATEERIRRLLAMRPGAPASGFPATMPALPPGLPHSDGPPRRRRLGLWY